MSDETKVTNEATEEQVEATEHNDEKEIELNNQEKNQSSVVVDNEDEAQEDLVQEDLEKIIADLKAEIEEKENRYLRLYADFENFRRRTKKEMEAAEKYRAQSLISNILPAIDNFERALQIEVDNDQAKSVLEGVEMVYRAIIDALKQEGAEQIEAVGQEFDPNLHEAIMQIEDDNFGPNTVVEEFQKGYKLNDRVIRPSMVKVNK